MDCVIQLHDEDEIREIVVTIDDNDFNKLEKICHNEYNGSSERLVKDMMNHCANVFKE